MKTYILIILIAISLSLLSAYNDVYLVKLDGTGDFTNIRDAVDAVQTSAIIYVYGPGTYTGINNRNISWNGSNKHIYLSGLIDPVIDCENEGRAFVINNGTEEDVIQGFTINNACLEGCNGGAIFISNGNPQISDNVFNNCSSGYYPSILYISNGGAIYIEDCNGAVISGNTFTNNVAFSGGAIYADNCSLSLLDNTFIGNSSGHYIDGSDGSTGIAGALHINNCFETTVSNNTFEGNTTNNGAAALAVQGSIGDIFIYNNNFSNNTFGSLNTLGEFGKSILFILGINGIIDVKYNTFINNNITDENTDLSSVIDDASVNSIITNNSFIFNYDFRSVVGFHQTMDMNITNCLFLNNNVNYLSSGYNGNSITLNYCSTYQSGALGDAIEGTGCLIDEDPEIDENYQPIWDSNAFSPCIDAGDPTSPLDPDETRSDIGAIPAISHKYDVWQLPDTGTDNGWKWLCFPALDDITAAEDYDGDVASYMLEDIMNPSDDPDLDYVAWKPYGDDLHYIERDEYNNWENELHTFTSPQGYKFKMQGDEPYDLEISGFLEDSNTTINLEGNGAQTWIGYFLEGSLNPEEAFGDVWDNITSIKTQHWAIFKDGVQQHWRYTLNYGDMAIVACKDDCSFSWNGNSPPVDPKSPKEPEYYSYEEQEDYIPIFLELDPEDRPTEIGVMLDGECKGASVIEDTTSQVNAYVMGDEGSEVEFEFYYELRKPKKLISEYFIYDPETKQKSKGTIKVSNKRDYYVVSFREDSCIEVPEKLSISNHPNPFNPETVIDYSLPKESKVELSVYNIKGQRVITLVNENVEAGKYSVTWNGKDDSGKDVTSGIYFSKLRTDSKEITRKMLLLK